MADDVSFQKKSHVSHNQICTDGCFQCVSHRQVNMGERTEMRDMLWEM